MSAFPFWQKWLLIVGLIVAVFGGIMAFFSATPLFTVFNRQIDPAFWGGQAPDAAARQFQQWIYAVWGATIAGWGIFIAFIAHYPYRQKERWARNCLVLGLLVWYLLDTSLSAIYRVYFNLAFNTILLILTMLPIIFTRKDFTG